MFRNFLYTVLALASISCCFSCATYHIRWRDGYIADIGSYASAHPLYNVMIPSKEQCVEREITDIYSVQDFNDDDSGTFGTVTTNRNDEPIETYFERHATGAPLTTYDIRQPSLAHSPVAKTMITTTDQVYSYYAVKMTAGMIYMSDFDCGTEFAHPPTVWEKDGEMDHNIYLTESGTPLPIESNTNYCFFTLIPKNKNDLGPYYGRVHPEDNDSLKYIANGMAPYVKLDPAIQSELEDNKGKIIWAGGRYIIPGEGGRFLLPHNGFNFLFNRIIAYRPYHKVEVRMTTDTDMTTWGDANRLDPSVTIIPPMYQDLSYRPEDMFVINGGPFLIRGFRQNKEVALHFKDEDSGIKNTWGGGTGDYLAFGPPDDPAKNWYWAMQFPTDEAENIFLQAAVDGTYNGDPFPINDNRSGDSGYGDRALPQSELAAFLTEARRFQLMVKTGYLMHDGIVTSPSVICGETDTYPADGGKTEKLCQKYGPLAQEMRDLLNNQLNTDPDNPDGWLNLSREMRPATGAGATVGGASISYHPKMNIVQNYVEATGTLYAEYNTDKTSAMVLNGSVDVDGVAMTAFDFNKWCNDSDVGRDIGSLEATIWAPSDKDDRIIADRDLISEYTNYKTLMSSLPTCDYSTSNLTATMACLNGIYSPVVSRYKELETNFFTQGSFKYYTTNDPEGKTLLAHLAYIQKYLDTNEDYAGKKVKWNEDAFQSSDISSVCDNITSLISAASIPATFPTTPEFVTCMEALSGVTTVNPPPPGNQDLIRYRPSTCKIEGDDCN